MEAATLAAAFERNCSQKANRPNQASQADSETAQLPPTTHPPFSHAHKWLLANNNDNNNNKSKKEWETNTLLTLI